MLRASGRCVHGKRCHACKGIATCARVFRAPARALPALFKHMQGCYACARKGATYEPLKGATHMPARGCTHESVPAIDTYFGVAHAWALHAHGVVHVWMLRTSAYIRVGPIPQFGVGFWLQFLIYIV